MTLNACVLILIRRGYLTFPRHGDRGIKELISIRARGMPGGVL